MEKSKYETCVLAGGCFWCMEAVFQDIKGIVKVESGFSGGHVENPTYKEVCTGNTGHAESIRITFDPAIISFSTILDIFFTMHDPTTPNRQGEDIGTQYRSEVFYMDDDQKHTVENFIKNLEEKKVFKDPIVTKVEKFKAFYPAEDYHRNYYKNNSNQPYCKYVISPKVQKLKDHYSPILKS
ncbi:MAG: peptide-methionine (S)-S-oxide reductase MsrA [Thermoplasmata archaeon]